MEKEIIELWDKNKGYLEKLFKFDPPETYFEMVKGIVSNVLNPENKDRLPDPDNIHEIDDGDYQGTLVYVIPEVGYQPDKYWITKVYYGSCSGCDTLEAIRDSDCVDENIKDYMTLALHIVQEMKCV